MDKKGKEGVYDHEGCYGEYELGLDPGRERSDINGLPWDTVELQRAI